jgi:hypothetical protein
MFWTEDYGLISLSDTYTLLEPLDEKTLEVL